MRSTAFIQVGRSTMTANPVTADIVLGDTMGELLMLYGTADIAFVGGSLVPVGGHNLIEPAAWQLPIITGEHLFNFSEVSHLLKTADALLIVNGATTLAAAVIELLQDTVSRHAMGQRAQQVAESNRGALQRLIQVVQPFL